ncbi:MAG: outer membrane beta-barrel protein, partial [Opitutae bacterium]|nr:outer membrane beta-barrel protein [Opitutae bacterium]
MKNKIAIASAFVAASSFSMGEIVVNDFLSFEGFVDSSYSHTDSDVNGNENSFAVDQVEISWLFDFDAVTAQVDLQYEGDSNEGTNQDGELVEQAFVNYALANGDVATAGRYASMLGFEAFEPTGLYQYSTAYVASGLPGYAQGVKYTRESDASFFGLSIQDEAFDNGQDNLSSSSFAIEAAYAQDLGNGLTVFLGGAYEDADAGDSYIVNAYA